MQNKFKDNTFRNGSSSESKKNRKPSTLNGRQEEENPAFTLQNGRLIKIFGLIALFIALFLLLAFISYLFTWQEDQSYVDQANGGWHNLFKSVEELKNNHITVHISNWAGKLGALSAHQFIYAGFGIASFLFVWIFFVIGYRLLFKITLMNLPKMIAYSLFLLIFISTTLGYLHHFFQAVPHLLEGQFGFFANQLLTYQTGTIGAGFLLIFAGLVFLVTVYNINFNHPQWHPQQQAHQHTATIENQTDTQNQIKNTPLQNPISPNPTDIDQHYPQENPQFDTNTPPHTHQDTPANSPIFEVVKNTENTHQYLPPHPTKAHPASHQSTPEDSIEMTVLTPTEPSEDLELPNIQKPTPHTEEDLEETANLLVQTYGTYDPTLDLKDYQLPNLALLKDYGDTNKVKINGQELEANKDSIVRTLGQFDIKIDKIKATVGPTVTLYEIIPAPGIRISKIKNLEDDIALNLAALGIRIIAPMPGKGTIGIEVPNKNPEMVSMRTVLYSDKFQNTQMDLPIALGKNISNEVFVADLAKMPHLLVAGATGQGKSVGINAILISLLYKKHPSELKFILVDPKKVELSLFRTIERHFLAKLPDEEEAIITDTKKVVNTLNSLCIEMDQRYELLKNASVRNLKEYNQKFINRKLNPENGHRYLPYIVLVIDEFADLIMTAGKEVEIPVARLAQLARAIGIHLVVATQRPSVNVITGMIKANFPARLAFRVLSGVDSKTILDTGGADQLIGRGDMLLSLGNDLIRLQCAFLDTPEAESIAQFIGAQRGYTDAYLLPEYNDENAEANSSKDFDTNDKDPLFEEAARLIVMHQSGSTSLIQRKMKLGYNRAGRIMDQLEAAGIVGAFQGSKVRDVLFPDEYSLEQFLDSLNN